MNSIADELAQEREQESLIKRTPEKVWRMLRPNKCSLPSDAHVPDDTGRQSADSNYLMIRFRRCLLAGTDRTSARKSCMDKRKEML